MAGQVVEELLDDAHMFQTDLALCLRGGGVRQRGRQRFTGDGLARPQKLGLLDPPPGFLLRLASCLLMRSFVASTSAKFVPPSALGSVSAANRLMI